MASHKMSVLDQFYDSYLRKSIEEKWLRSPTCNAVQKKTPVCLFWYQLWSLFSLKIARKNPRASGERASKSSRKFEGRERARAALSRFFRERASASARSLALSSLARSRCAFLEHCRVLRRPCGAPESRSFQLARIAFSFTK